MGFIQDNPVLASSIVGAGAVGIASAFGTFKKTRGDTETRLNSAGMEGTRAAIGTGILAGAGYLGYRSRSTLGNAARGVGRFFQRQYKDTLLQSSNDRMLLSTLVPTDAAHAAMIEGRGAETMSQLGVMTQAYGRNGRLMTGGGALAGLAIGSAFGHPLMGAAAGAGAGFAVKAGIGGAGVWKKLSKIPGGRTTAVLAASTLLFAGIQAMTPTVYQSESAATRDGLGGYEAGPLESGVKSRLNAMQAHGDMVMGLNHMRHGF